MTNECCGIRDHGLKPCATCPVLAESETRRGRVEAQDQALARWRKGSDEDAGKIARYEKALRDIATLPAIGTARLAISIARKELGNE